MATQFQEIQTRFHSMPRTKYEIPEALEAEWLKTAVADYELNIGCNLDYDEDNQAFYDTLDNQVIRTLAQMMYVSHLRKGHSDYRAGRHQARDKTGAGGSDRSCGNAAAQTEKACL